MSKDKGETDNFHAFLEQQAQNKEGGFGKQILSKNDAELYDEESNVVHPVYRIKRTAGKDEKWKIFKDNKPIMTVDGSKLSSKERDFLRGVDGVKFLLAECKIGLTSFSALKKKIKEALTS